MAPPRLYELPHEQLVRLLREAKLEGLSFEEAWDRAIRPRRRAVLANVPDPPAGAVRWPTDSSDRANWQAAIYAVKDGFRRAYQQRPPTARELAVARVTAWEGIGQAGAVASAA